MTTLVVDPVIYSMAGASLHGYAVAFQKIYASQMSALSDTSAMGGNVGVSKEWAASYDDNVAEAMSLTQLLIEAMGNYANILQAYGYNYAVADHDRGSGRAAPVKSADLPPTWASCLIPPPSAGGPNSGLFDDVGLAVSALENCGVSIPDGEPEKLKIAADAWGKFASTDGAGNLPALLDRLATSFAAETDPVLEWVDDDLRDLKESAVTVLSLYSDLELACREHKAAIDQLREKLKELLEQLAIDITIEIATGVVFSIVAGALTAGFGAAAVAAAKTASIANKVRKYADRIGGIIGDIKFLKKLNIRDPPAPKKPILQRLKNLWEKVKESFSGRKKPAQAELTQNDVDALGSYTGAGSRDINSALRTDNISPAQQARIDDVNAALAKLPDHEGVVYRGTQLPRDVIDSYKEGEVVTEKAFTSSSVNPGGAFNGDTRFRIVSKTGKDVSPYSTAQQAGHMEDEVLFKSGTKFNVTRNYTDPNTGVTYIDMVEA